MEGRGAGGAVEARKEEQGDGGRGGHLEGEGGAEREGLGGGRGESERWEVEAGTAQLWISRERQSGKGFSLSVSTSLRSINIGRYRVKFR